jgi:predicted DNA-binding protein (MmcQ/YjbR family)
MRSASLKRRAVSLPRTTTDTGFAPAPYLARVKWVQLTEPKALPLAHLKDLVERSRALVLGGLSKKFQNQLLG